MHQAVLGVTRQLLKVWFLPKYHNSAWYIGRRIGDVDTLLMAICPTMEVGRLPRCLADTMKYWKGFFLYILWLCAIILKLLSCTRSFIRYFSSWIEDMASLLFPTHLVGNYSQWLPDASCSFGGWTLSSIKGLCWWHRPFRSQSVLELLLFNVFRIVWCVRFFIGLSVYI